MAKLINLQIDLSKIDKTKIITTDKNGQPFQSGAKYYSVTLSVNDDFDKFGNDIGCWNPQTKEQVAAKEKKIYLGNGKTFWSNDANFKKAEPQTDEQRFAPVDVKPVEDLPF